MRYSVTCMLVNLNSYCQDAGLRETASPHRGQSSLVHNYID
jgi:hypothetical protein